MLSTYIKTALKNYECHEIKPGSSGNRRYVVHFLSIGLTDYPDTIPQELKKLGLKKYRGRDFTGGYVFYAWNPNITLDLLFIALNPAPRTRAKLITSTNSRLLGNIYTGQEYSDITWWSLQDRTAEYPELVRHEANSACYFEDATQGFVDENGKFYPISI